MIGLTSIKKTIKTHIGITILVAVVLLFHIILSTTGSGRQLAPVNLATMSRQNAYIVILGLGMLILLLTGGNIDFSIGALVSMLTAMASVLMGRMNMDTPLALLIMIACGVLVGAWNGFWIAAMRVPAFLVTLLGMFVLRGVSLILLRGANVAAVPDIRVRFLQATFPSSGNTIVACVAAGAVFSAIYILLSVIGRVRRKKLGDAIFLGSPFAFTLKMAAVLLLTVCICYIIGETRGFSFVFLLTAALVLAYSFVMQRTPAGRYIYAMGGNESAARLAGIATRKVLFFAYMNMGFLASIAAIISIGRFNSAATTDEPLVNTLGACFLGGVSAYGGSGKISGVVAGAAAMAFINNGMSMLGISTSWQHVVQGLILILVLALNIRLSGKSRA